MPEDSESPRHNADEFTQKPGLREYLETPSNEPSAKSMGEYYGQRKRGGLTPAFRKAIETARRALGMKSSATPAETQGPLPPASPEQK